MRKVHIDDIVERRSAVRLAPHFARDHLPRHRSVMVLRKKCEQIELARCECNLPLPTRDTTRLHIEREITDLLPQSVSGIGPPKQSTNPREQLSEGKGFYQIIIRSGVQAEHAILNRIASSEQHHGCFGTACAKRPEHFATNDQGIRRCRCCGFLERRCPLPRPQITSRFGTPVSRKRSGSGLSSVSSLSAGRPGRSRSCKPSWWRKRNGSASHVFCAR